MSSPWDVAQARRLWHDAAIEISPIRKGLLLGLVAGVLLTAAPAASGAPPLRGCGGGVRAAKVDCGKAKRIAAEYRRTGRRNIWMYTCSRGGDHGRCVLDRKVVIFPLG